MTNESRIILPDSPEIILPDSPEIIAPQAPVIAAPAPQPGTGEPLPIRCDRPRDVRTEGNCEEVGDSQTNRPGHIYTLRVDAGQTANERTRGVAFVPVPKGSDRPVLALGRVLLVSQDDLYRVGVDDDWRGLKVILVATHESIDFGHKNFTTDREAMDFGHRHFTKEFRAMEFDVEPGDTRWLARALQAAAKCLENAVLWLK